jgi:hypothetical protein
MKGPYKHNPKSFQKMVTTLLFKAYIPLSTVEDCIQIMGTANSGLKKDFG